MAGLAGHLEGDAIGSSVLELEGSGVEVVEILVEELEAMKVSICHDTIAPPVRRLRVWV